MDAHRLQNLPFTITSLPLLKAVWLSENQSQPMPHFSTDYVLGEPVLTCYLLPQMSADMQPSEQQQQHQEQEQQLPRKCYMMIIYALFMA